MVNLINRDPPGRLSCLHALLRSLERRFNTTKFTGDAAKHQVGADHNPIDYCTCAKEYSQSTALVLGEKRYCPFLQSGPSKSYCYLVNSNQLDTQKSKAVGLAITALEALGLVNRKLNALKRLETAKLTAEGIRISKYNFLDPEVQTFYRQQVVNYGPAVGFLHIVDTLLDKPEIRHSEISGYMGRPNNNDKVLLSSGDEVKLNDGDAQDARTRTSGALQAWLTYAGYINPKPTFFGDFSQVDEYYCNPENKLGYHRIFPNKKRIKQFFSAKPFVSRPLSYDFYIKGGGTAREYSQRSTDGIQLENMALKEFSSKVRNRRFLLMLAYAKASSLSKGLNLRTLANFSNFRDSPFVVNADTHERIMIETEVDFLTIAGAPFIRSSKDFEVVYPRVTIDADVIAKESPFVATSVDRVTSKKGIFV